MRTVHFALLVLLIATTGAFTNEIADADDSLRITYDAPYYLKVNDSAIEIKFTENKNNLSMKLSDQTGNVIFCKDTVLLDHVNSISIPLADTSKPMTLDIRCASFTGKSFIPGLVK